MPQHPRDYLKVAKLAAGLVPTTAGTAVNGDILFSKEPDELVEIFDADLVLDNMNGLGTGSEVVVIVSRDRDQATIDLDDQDTLIAWSGVKSFVTSGMAIVLPILTKNFPEPLITTRDRLRVVALTRTANWTSAFAQVYLYYSTRKLDADSRRILTGIE